MQHNEKEALPYSRQTLKDAIAFVVLIIMLLVKPEGIMGRRNKV
jgi:branched-subunit amino acid ABC-type transport system permease component